MGTVLGIKPMVELVDADNAEKVREIAVEKYDYRNTVLYPIGSVVGTHLALMRS